MGIACAFFYHAGPLRLAYRGWGEAAVALCYGPLIATGTNMVQRGRISMDVVLASLPLGLLIAAFLWINQFPDYRADRAAGKRNLVVRLGRERASTGFALLVATALLLGLGLPGLGLPPGLWLGMLAAQPLQAAVRRVLTRPRGPRTAGAGASLDSGGIPPVRDWRRAGVAVVADVLSSPIR